MIGSYPKNTGALHMYQLSHGELKTLVETEKPHAFKCCTFAASSIEERHLATGDFAGNLNIWDLERPATALYSVKAHKTMMNAIDGCGGANIGYGAPEIATAGRDGAVKIWDPRQRDVPVASLEARDEAAARDCWCVAFGNSYNDQERVVVAGYDNGDVKMYDLRTNLVRWETNVRNGVCSIEFDRKDIEMNKMVLTTLESQFRVFDLRTYHPKTGYESLVQGAHKSTVWATKHLPQNRDVFVTCGGDGSVNLWK